MVHERQARLFDPTQDLFAVGGRFGDGRYLGLADHSVFLNVMVLTEQNPNGNLEFTDACINWLRGPEGKNRCLFVEDGAIKTTFDLPLPEIDLLPFVLQSLLVLEKHGDQLVREMEQQDSFNHTTQSLFGRRAVVRFVLIALTSFLMFVGFTRLMRARTAPDPARTLVTPEIAALIPRGNALQQRFEGLLELENIYGAAREMVREYMAGIDAEPGTSEMPPHLVIRENARDANHLRRRIMRLWQIGFGSQPIKIKPTEWRALTEDLKEVLEKADNGVWHFLPVAN